MGDQYDEMNGPQLQEELRRRGLPANGSKVAMAERLREHDQRTPGAAGTSDPAATGSLFDPDELGAGLEPTETPEVRAEDDTDLDDHPDGPGDDPETQTPPSGGLPPLQGAGGQAGPQDDPPKQVSRIADSVFEVVYPVYGELLDATHWELVGRARDAAINAGREPIGGANCARLDRVEGDFAYYHVPVQRG